jgi:hypothetical protein
MVTSKRIERWYVTPKLVDGKNGMKTLFLKWYRVVLFLAF